MSCGHFSRIWVVREFCINLTLSFCRQWKVYVAWALVITDRRTICPVIMSTSCFQKTALHGCILSRENRTITFSIIKKLKKWDLWVRHHRRQTLWTFAFFIGGKFLIPHIDFYSEPPCILPSVDKIVCSQGRIVQMLSLTFGRMECGAFSFDASQYLRSGCLRLFPIRERERERKTLINTKIEGRKEIKRN